MINLEYICFLNETGYGQAAFDTIQSLLQSNRFNIKINCINNRPTSTCLDAINLQKISSLINNKLYSNIIQVYHCIPSMQFRFPRNQRAVAFATFETYDPPQDWITILNKADAIICPSKFNYKIFAHCKIDRPIFYIPHCFDTNIYNEKIHPIEERKPFTFLFFGTWKRRKGWNVLLEAYLQSFKSSDDVQLLIKTDKINQAVTDIEKMQSRFANKKDLPSILLERRVYDNLHLPAFLKSVDCLVSPTLGEGFGLPALQCMALKVPVIITNFSGCQDYANDQTCTLIEPNGFIMERTMDSISQFANKKWPHLTVESVANCMLQVFHNYDAAISKAENAYKFVHQNFNYNVSSSAFIDMMENVYREN